MPRRVDRGMENYSFPAANKMEVCGVGSVPIDCERGAEHTPVLPQELAYRVAAQGEDFVIRAGHGITIDPYSLARPMRTNYPLLVVFEYQREPAAFQAAGSLRAGGFL